MSTMEARFLASQAERLADNKRRQQKYRQNQLRNNDNNDGHHQPLSSSSQCYFEDAPNLCSEDENAKIIVDTDPNNDDGHHSSHKEEGHRFWMNFRKLCSELQSQVDSLLQMTPDEEGSSSNDGKVSKYETSLLRSLDG